VSTDKVKHNSQWHNCMTHHQVLTATAAIIIHTTEQLCLISCKVLVTAVCADMVPYSVEQHVFLCESYVKCGSTRKSDKILL
jgi:hypothetical protein